MRLFRAFTVALALFAAGPCFAASVPLVTGAQDPSQLNATINGVIQSINSLITPNSMAPQNTPRNYLDNGDMTVNQLGTGTITCGTTSGIPIVTGYNADRWGCVANVTSGAGRTSVITSSPTPPIGFQNEVQMFRTSGALTQPICTLQEVPTSESTEMAGQSIVFSAYVQALAGLAADNANAFNLVIFTGTGSDQGLQTFTASPAITPAWTGIATLVNQAYTASASAWGRVSTTAIAVPTNVTEIAVGICFTPTATGAGATDGLAFTGAQLEVGSAASAYEFKPVGVELARAQRYLYVVNEAAAGVAQTTVGTAQGTTTTCTAYVPFPVPMRAAPTYTNTLSATTFKLVSASQVATALSTPFSATLVANTVNGGSINFTTTGMTAKDSCFLVGAASTGTMIWSSNF